MDKQLRILILEDNDTDAELMKHELRKGNIIFESKCVETREDFKKSLEDFAPDLILADYTLPAFDGRSALRISNEKLPYVPFIFVSGTIGEDFAIESLKSGATDYVLKDRMSRLAPAVNRALREAEEKVEYKKAEKALKDSELRFRSVVQSANDAIILTDGNGNIISWNKEAEAIFGYTEKEVLGKPITHIMPQRYRDRHQKKLEYVSLVGKFDIIGKTVESYGLRKDGSEFPLEISAAMWKTEEGTFYSGIIRDITERKKAEEELLKFKLGLERSGEAIFITDPDGTIVYVNPAFEKIYGYSKEETLGKTPSILKSGLLPSEAYKPFWETLLAKKVVSGELTNKTSDGRLLNIESTANPILYNGNIVGFLAIQRDVSERKRAEEELKIKARLLDDATDSIFVHDLDGNFIYLNEGAYKSRGFNKEEIMGMNLHEIVTPEYERLLNSRFNRLIEDGEGTFESAHFRKDKSVMPVESHARIIESSGRKLVLNVIRDITERKRAEKELQYRLEFEKLITSISTNFINITSDEIDGAINRALKAIGEFTGVDRSYVFMVSKDGTRIDNTHEWCAGQDCSQLQHLKGLHFDSFPWFAGKMRKHETISISRVADMPPDATAEIAALQKSPIKSLIDVPMVYGGVLFGYLGLTSVQKELTWSEDQIALLKIVGEIFVNALVRKMAEAAVWESESRFRAIFEEAAIGMALVNMDGHAIVSNPALQEMLGYSGEELRTMAFTDFTHPDDIPANLNFFKELVAGKRDYYQMEKRYIKKNGALIWVRLTSSLIRGDGGEPRFSIGMVEDITERKKTEKLLKEKARAELYGFIVSALPAFVSGVPSQVRNTLVKNFAERFERNIRPRFEEKTKQLNLYFDDGIYNIFDVFMLWIAGLFSSLGIKTRTTPRGGKRSFELLNCPWKGEASGNPIFCFICRTIVMRSFTWTSLKGNVDQKSSIANGSQTCMFEINTKPAALSR